MATATSDHGEITITVKTILTYYRYSVRIEKEKSFHLNFSYSHTIKTHEWQRKQTNKYLTVSFVSKNK